MVNQNLWRAALFGLGLTVSSGAYAQDKSGETLIPGTGSVEVCPTCPPNVQVNVNTQPPQTEKPKPETDEPAGKNDCDTLWGGKGKCMSYKDARKAELRIYKEGHCPDNTRCYKTTTTSDKTVVAGKKKVCTELFDGNGRCISHTEAKMGGFTTYERGHCPGKDFCYNTTKPVAEEKKAESKLETAVQQEAVLPIDPAYYKSFSGCDAENAQRESLLHEYEASKAGCETAKKNLNDYTANTVPALKEGADKPAAETQPAAGLTPKADVSSEPQPSLPTETAGENAEKKEVFNADTARNLEAEVDRLCGEAKQYDAQLTNLVAGVKQNGCNYKEPAAPKAERGVEFDAAARGTYDGALGAELDAALLLPVGNRGHLGIYGNGTIPGTGVDNTATHSEKDLGGFEQYESRSVDSSRVAGMGAQAGYDLTSWLRGYFRGGVALTEENTQRTIDILGDQKSISGDDKSVHLEGALGVQLGGKHVYVPLEFRYNDTTGPTATTGVGGRF